VDARFADAVIVAAGSSSRMGGVDKLLEPLGGKPLLAWSVEAMAAAESIRRIVVVTRAERVADMARQDWLSVATVVAGGEQRSDSVRAGLSASDADVVLVHDGARPLASSALADAVARAAAEHGAAIPSVPVADSLKRANGGRLEAAVEREGIVRAQTPQGARRELLVTAFERAGASAYTDEAALLEAAGTAVVTVPGEATNIKVTDRSDLDLVRAIVRGRADERIGFGEDAHGFGPADGLRIGGIEIAEAPRLFGHSDGDVVLHALATAILAACGLGDLGRLFPPSDPSTAGIASDELLVESIRQAEQAGWKVDRAQVSIVGARPKLGARRLDAIRGRIATLLGFGTDSVAVTASTGNLSGAEGAGRVIRATALVTVIRR
jgi:2-C-methyl-D-erythritol 4-phosphate cytidylyltransferase/2-C-methyl-D-erythritol 2,4-cyclodiphosphate synthase